MGPVLPEYGSHSEPAPTRRSGMRAARIGRATDMSMRPTKWPRQWWAPPPKPKCGVRPSTVMSKAGLSTASGSVPADSENRWIVVPAGI